MSRKLKCLVHGKCSNISSSGESHRWGHFILFVEQNKILLHNILLLYVTELTTCLLACPLHWHRTGDYAVSIPIMHMMKFHLKILSSGTDAVKSAR